METALKLNSGEHLKQISTCRNLTPDSGMQERICVAVADLYKEISSRGPFRIPSRENWCLERVTTLAERNKSPEVVLERAIAVVAENGSLENWYNQIPVASGLIDERANKRAAIDLIEFSEDRVAFVELKWESDTPAYAAVEILRYAMAYLLCRDNREEFGYEDKSLMFVDTVDLQVLAPAVFYDKCDLQFLAMGIGEGLERLCADRTDNLKMTFEFRSFQPCFKLPFANGAEVEAIRGGHGDTVQERLLIDAINNTQPVWGS